MRHGAIVPRSWPIATVLGPVRLGLTGSRAAMARPGRMLARAALGTAMFALAACGTTGKDGGPASGHQGVPYTAADVRKLVLGGVVSGSSSSFYLRLKQDGTGIGWYLGDRYSYPLTWNIVDKGAGENVELCVHVTGYRSPESDICMNPAVLAPVSGAPRPPPLAPAPRTAAANRAR